MAVDPVSLAITAGLMAAQMALTATQKIKGPRLDDLNVSMADYGTPIPRIWGTRRINPQIIWAEKLREKKKKSKTKGGKYTEYKYFGTWAVLLCDHEIDAVTRIWFDKRLIYQRTGIGPISVAAAVASTLGGGDSGEIKLSNGNNMRVYLGTETQEPDPRIESWCEDRYGADSCPAYRGSAYIVFEEIPLETVGNRIPQITVELVNNKTDNYPYESKDRDLGLLNARFSPDRTRLVLLEGTSLNIWDVPTRTLILDTTAPAFMNPFGFGIVPDGTFYAISGFPSQELWLFGESGGSVVTDEFDQYAWGCEYVGGQVCIYPYSFLFDQILFLTATETGEIKVGARDADFTPTHYFEDSEGEAWAVGDGGTNTIGFSKFSGADRFEVTSPGDGWACAMDNGQGQLVVYHQGGWLLLVDKETQSVVTTLATFDTASFDTFATLRNEFAATAPGATSLWIRTREYNTADLTLIRTIDFDDWTTEAVRRSIYDPINDAKICESLTGDNMTWRYLDRVGSEGVTLQTVVDDVSEWVGLTDQDSSALTQTVEGYSITQGQAKDMLAPLLDIHDVDARPHDFAVQFKVRGSAPSGSIATADLVRENGPRYTVTVQQDTDLPRRVTVNFADKGKDQQNNTAIAQRPLDAVNSNREETIDLSTYVDTPDGAQQKVDRYFRRAWNSRERTSASLTYQKIGLEPGDVTTIELDGSSRNVRVDKATIGLNQISCEFVRDETSFAAINTATTGADMDGRDDEEIFIPGPVKGIIIDGPLAADVDNEANPIIYYLSGPYAGGFSGAVVAEGDGIDFDEIAGAVDSSQEATWGLATNVLATANPNLWDRGNTVNINLRAGSLTSVTEADIDADPQLNLAAFGVDGRWEYLNFTTATLQGDGSYTLSGFKRGRRGTENYRDDHATGDVFVLLDNRVSDERGVDDIGETLTFKVQAPLRDIEAAPPITLEYDANSLKPYAPTSFKAAKDTDAALTWIRRTRLGGAWNGGSTIPLSEDSESYEIDIYLGATFKRTLTSSTPSKTYTAAEMATDGTGSGFTANLYQLSATVGRGEVNSTTFAF